MTRADLDEIRRAWDAHDEAERKHSERHLLIPDETPRKSELKMPAGFDVNRKPSYAEALMRGAQGRSPAATSLEPATPTPKPKRRRRSGGKRAHDDQKGGKLVAERIRPATEVPATKGASPPRVTCVCVRTLESCLEAKEHVSSCTRCRAQAYCLFEACFGKDPRPDCEVRRGLHLSDERKAIAERQRDIARRGQARGRRRPGKKGRDVIEPGSTTPTSGGTPASSDVEMERPNNRIRGEALHAAEPPTVPGQEVTEDTDEHEVPPVPTDGEQGSIGPAADTARPKAASPRGTDGPARKARNGGKTPAKSSPPERISTSSRTLSEEARERRREENYDNSLFGNLAGRIGEVKAVQQTLGQAQIQLTQAQLEAERGGLDPSVIDSLMATVEQTPPVRAGRDGIGRRGSPGPPKGVSKKTTQGIAPGHKDREGRNQGGSSSIPKGAIPGVRPPSQTGLSPNWFAPEPPPELCLIGPSSLDELVASVMPVTEDQAIWSQGQFDMVDEPRVNWFGIKSRQVDMTEGGLIRVKSTARKQVQPFRSSCFTSETNVKDPKSVDLLYKFPNKSAAALCECLGHEPKDWHAVQGATAHKHPASATVRLAAHTLSYGVIADLDVTDVGGNPCRHAAAKHRHVHCCNPLACEDDAGRLAKWLAEGNDRCFMVKGCEFTSQVSRCSNTGFNCQADPQALLSVDTIYYLGEPHFIELLKRGRTELGVVVYHCLTRPMDDYMGESTVDMFRDKATNRLFVRMDTPGNPQPYWHPALNISSNQVSKVHTKVLNGREEYLRRSVIARFGDYHVVLYTWGEEPMTRSISMATGSPIGDSRQLMTVHAMGSQYDIHQVYLEKIHIRFGGVNYSGRSILPLAKSLANSMGQSIRLSPNSEHLLRTIKERYDQHASAINMRHEDRTEHEFATILHATVLAILNTLRCSGSFSIEPITAIHVAKRALIQLGLCHKAPNSATADLLPLKQYTLPCVSIPYEDPPAGFLDLDTLLEKATESVFQLPVPTPVSTPPVIVGAGYLKLGAFLLGTSMICCLAIRVLLTAPHASARSLPPRLFQSQYTPLPSHTPASTTSWSLSRLASWASWPASQSWKYCHTFWQGQDKLQRALDGTSGALSTLKAGFGDVLGTISGDASN